MSCSPNNAAISLLNSNDFYFYLQYEGSIVENTQGLEVMRLKADDLDLKDTDNWEPVYDIVKGNEAGYFSIKTDPKTKEGILMLDKVLLQYKDVCVSSICDEMYSIYRIICYHCFCVFYSL